jgi:metal-responsive CopG/Arc/MetJ family transcriptional regulator
MKTSDMTKVTISLDPAIVLELDIACQRRNISRVEYIRRIIGKHMTKLRENKILQDTIKCSTEST